MEPSPSRVLAQVLLDRIPEAETTAAIRDIAASLSLDANGYATAHLVIQLLEQMPDDDARAKLEAFIQRAIESNDKRCTAFKDLAGICHSDQKLLSASLSKASHVLQTTCKTLGLGFCDAFAPPTDAFLRKYMRFVPEELLLRQDPVANSDVTLDVALKYLEFVKFLLWSTAHTMKVTSEVAFALLALLGACDSKVSSTAWKTLSALLSGIIKDKVSVGAENTGFGSQRFGDSIWDRILNLASEGCSQYYLNTAVKLWLQWVVLPERYRPSKEILKMDGYWYVLQIALRDGSQERRKSCLYIIRMSLQQLETDVMTDHLAFRVKDKILYDHHYAKYCTLFETVVLGRYINQVEDSFGDLKAMFASTSLVHGSWLLVLLTAALSPEMQDSIRGVVGRLIMTSEYDFTSVQAKEHVEFLHWSFLPWASQGQLFTSSVGRSVDGEKLCRQGEALIRFVDFQLAQARDAARRGAVAKGILKFVEGRGKNMFPYASAYILQGLVNGLQSHGVSLGPDSMELIYRIPSVSGYSELARDLFMVSCFQLAAIVDPGVRDKRQYESLEVAFRKLSITPTDTLHQPSSPADLSLETFVTRLRETQHGSLRGASLGPSEKRLRAVLEHSQIAPHLSHDTHASGLVITALEAVWEEIEVQDYPKPLLMSFPTVLLHHTCIELSRNDASLARCISNIMVNMQRLSDNRIYAFPPLAAALRQGLLASPKAAPLFLEDFVVRFATHPPIPKIEFQLEAAIACLLQKAVPERTYQHYYGNEEGYGYACIFDLLNRKDVVSRSLGKRIINRLLEPWVDQKQPVPINSKWKTTTQLQVVLVVYETCRGGVNDGIAETEQELSILQKLLDILSVEPMPRFRFLMEWIIARICRWHPNRQGHLFSQLASKDHSNPKYFASTIRTATAVACSDEMNEDLTSKLMALLVPLAASPKIIVRHEAQWSLPRLYDHAATRGWTALTENPAFAALNGHICSLDQYRHPPWQRVIEKFDLVSDHNLTNLFQGDYLRIEPSEQSLVSRDDFLAVLKDDGKRAGPNISEVAPGSGDQSAFSIPLGDPRPMQDIVAKPLQTADEAADRVTAAPLQTKSTAWQSNILSSLSHPASDCSAPLRQSHDLIIIASLIDNAYNLGGLSRVSEIFGAKSLHVRNINVLHEKNFTSVAVSSELHLPISQLPIAAVEEFLVQRKMEGYKVVGVEQTDSSVVLPRNLPRWKETGMGSSYRKQEGEGEWEWSEWEGGVGLDKVEEKRKEKEEEARRPTLPEKCVLVLGSEKEGIPARILADMDFCVEIAQCGVTRSLNVQTAAAVVMYEYLREHGRPSR